VEAGVAEKGWEVGSQQHWASVQLRPLDPAIRDVVDGIIEREGALSEASLQLL